MSSPNRQSYDFSGKQPPEQTSPYLPKFQQHTSQWDQFESFRKRIHEDKQHFKSPKRDPESLERVTAAPNVSQNETVLRLKLENQVQLLTSMSQELRDKSMHLQRELDEKQHLMEKVKEGHQVQIRQIREKYEYENSDLSSKLNSFTDQLESLNLTYKEKNTKLYSMVIQLEREKQELVEQMIQQKDRNPREKETFQQFSDSIRELQQQIVTLEGKHTKVLKEKEELQQKYNLLVTQCSDQLSRKYQNEYQDSQPRHFKAKPFDKPAEKPPLGESLNNRSTQSLVIDHENNTSTFRVPPTQPKKKSTQQLEKHEKAGSRRNSAHKENIHESARKSVTQNSAKKTAPQDIGTPIAKKKIIQRSSTSHTLEKVSQSTHSVKQFKPQDSARKQTVTSASKPKGSNKKKKNPKNQKKVPIYSKAK